MTPESSEGNGGGLRDFVVPQWRSWLEVALGAVIVPSMIMVSIMFFWRDAKIFVPVEQSDLERGIMEEWFNEARIGQADLVGLARRVQELARRNQATQEEREAREDLLEFLDALGVPTSITINQQLPLFPNIYRLAVEFDDPDVKAVEWSSGLPRPFGAATKEWLVDLAGGSGTKVRAEGQLRTYQVRRAQEEDRRRGARKALAITSVVLSASIFWLGWSIRQRALSRKEKRKIRESQLEAAAEVFHAREEKLAAEAELLQNRLEQQDQILKSLQVVAGAYAHNLQNLLLPPGRLVDDCIRHESSKVVLDESVQGNRLLELKRLLGQVSDRVRQTLQALRRDPGQYQPRLVGLDKLAKSVHAIWKDLADQRWQIDVSCDVDSEGENPRGGPWLVWADDSHLAQALENLLVNSRDAIFERRSRMLKEAHAQSQGAVQQKESLLRVCGWRGKIGIRVSGSEGQEGPSLIVKDNGQGMSPEILENCLKPGYTTKQNNALVHGASSGMGLGLAFLSSTMEQMGARLEIKSNPEIGTRVAIHFPYKSKEISK
jgi:signal transduction histidine kinase